MTQLLLAVDLMHRQDIVHRDIKPENVLVISESDFQVCIADLGLASRLSDKTLLSQKCGSPGYVDPEVLKGFPFTARSDIFSLGCLLYDLVAQKMLFDGKNLRELLTNNQYMPTEKSVTANCPNVTPECRDLLNKMLEKSQARRMSAEDCLKHQWFKKDASHLRQILLINKQYTLLSQKGSFNLDGDSNQSAGGNSFASFIQGPNYFFVPGNDCSENSSLISSSMVRSPIFRS